MIRSLTSLRFFFALIVFFSHYYYIDGVIFAHGWIGVSFFFILSGFILSYSYKNRLFSGKVSYMDFYVARFARIYPLHLLTFLIFIPFLMMRYLPGWKVLVPNLLLLQSWNPFNYYTVNVPSWSISNEAFFYAVFPMILYFFMKNSRINKLLVITICFLVYSVLLFCLFDSSFNYYLFYVNPLFRLIDFVIGVFIYSIWEKYSQKNSMSILKATILEISTIGFFITMIWFSKYIHPNFTYACYYWFPMSAIIYLFAIQQKGLVSKLLSNKILVLAGDVSYAFYLFHIPVIRYCEIFFIKMNVMLDCQIPEWFKLILVVFTTSILSVLSYYFYEIPLNRKIKEWYVQYKRLQIFRIFLK